MFPSIETALEDCEKHLDATGARGTPIDAYLAGFLLIHTYAHFEKRILEICKQRCDHSGDPSIGALALNSLRKTRDSLYISDLGKNLKNFGEIVKAEFSTTVSNTPAHSAWDNILINRHDFAHKPILPTLNVADIRRFYNDSLAIIVEFENKIMGTVPVAPLAVVV